MKHFPIPFAGLLLALFGSVASFAQSTAPDSFNAQLLNVSISKATAPFTSSGSYKLFTSAVGSNYTVLGNPGTGFSSGTFSYSTPATNVGVLAFADTVGAQIFSARLLFTSSNAGTILLSNSIGSQTGSFVASTFATVSVPGLYFPVVTNHHFNAFLGGQPGFNYTIQSSGDATIWSNLTNLAISSLTTRFGDTNLLEQTRLYRARINSTAFAPTSISGKTFNFTGTNGATPLPTNGIFQLIPTDFTHLQLLGGPGFSNGGGSFTYSLTSGDSATISYVDSVTSANYLVRLVFISPQAGHFYLTVGAAFEAGTFSLVNGSADFVGNVRFTPDSSRRQSVSFPANGTATTLSVTNASGYVWTLSMPSDALITPRTISLTPFLAIDSSQSWLPIVAGVQLEPDGIQFSHAVNLTVTPPSPLGTNVMLMMAENDGSALYFVENTKQAGSYTLSLAHFTSANVANPSTQQRDDFANQYALVLQSLFLAAKADVDGLIGSPETPNGPPDYDLACNPAGTATAETLTDIYVSTLFQRETAAINRMMDAAQQLFVFTGDFSSVLLAKQSALQLVEAGEFTKIDLLFLTYGSDPRKLIPLVRSAQAAEVQDLMNGGTKIRQFSAQIDAAANMAQDYYFDRLKSDHDYSAISPLQRIHQIKLSAGTGGDDPIFAAKLSAELTFKLSLDITLNASSGHEEAKGDVILTSGSSPLPCSGSGTMNYISGNVGAATLLPGQTFSIAAKIDDVDTCDATTISIILNSFAASTELYTQSGITFSLRSPMGQSAAVVFHPQLVTSGAYAGLYSFHATLQNKSATAVSQTFTGLGQGGSVSVNAILTHTPQ